MKIEKALVVVAHPDDEILGCGGFIKKLTKKGVYVHIAYLNNGNSLRAEYSKIEIEKQIKKACGILGVLDYSIYGYETAKFEQYPQNEFNNVISKLIDKIKPDTILTHDEYDLHKDHQVVHEAVLVASRFKHGSIIKNVLTFPVISSSDINPQWKFLPNYYVDISNEIMNKIEAMKSYTIEYESLETHRGENAITVWSGFFGLQSNMKNAEIFKIIRGTYD